MVEIFWKKQRSLVVCEKLPDILRKIGKNNRYDGLDLVCLKNHTADEIFKMLKDNSGMDLKYIMNGIVYLKSGPVSGASLKNFIDFVDEALLRIGKESAINADRVGRYGITV